jgi:hypothetical protein
VPPDDVQHWFAAGSSNSAPPRPSEVSDAAAEEVP